MWILAYPHIAQVINYCVKHIYFNLFFCSLSIAFQKSKKSSFHYKIKKTNNFTYSYKSNYYNSNYINANGTII